MQLQEGPVHRQMWAKGLRKGSLLLTILNWGSAEGNVKEISQNEIL